MSTIQMTKKWHPEPAKYLVNTDAVKEGKKLSADYETQNSHLCAQDLMGLSWMLFDDMENDV